MARTVKDINAALKKNAEERAKLINNGAKLADPKLKKLSDEEAALQMELRVAAGQGTPQPGRPAPGKGRRNPPKPQPQPQPQPQAAPPKPPRPGRSVPPKKKAAVRKPRAARPFTDPPPDRPRPEVVYREVVREVPAHHGILGTLLIILLILILAPVAGFLIRHSLSDSSVTLSQPAAQPPAATPQGQPPSAQPDTPAADGDWKKVRRPPAGNHMTFLECDQFATDQMMTIDEFWKGDRCQ